MSNKMNKIIAFFLLMQAVLALQGFVPKQRDFSSEYQYRLFRSWSAREKPDKDLPARITHDLIERRLQFHDTEIEIVYTWENFKIYRQRENFPELLPWGSFQDELIIAGELFYRLNCIHKFFAVHYLQKMPVGFEFNGLKGTTAIDSLFRLYKDTRLPLERLHPVLKQDKLEKLIIQLSDGGEIQFVFSDLADIQKKLSNLKRFEWEFPANDLPEDFPVKKPEILPKLEIKKEKSLEKAEQIIEESPYKGIIRTPADSSFSSYESKLVNWIEKNKDSVWGCEMLNNKIENISEFLQNEFPSHSLLIKGNRYNLTRQPFAGNISSDLFLEAKENGGWSILASKDVNLNNKLAVIAGFEEFDLSELTETEAESISRYLPQFLIAHRSMSSRLAGFVLQPDITETTLVIDGSKRKVFNIKSYHDLILLLGNFWKNRTIYYTVNNFKIIDGFIEFNGYLAAEDSQNGTYDLAEVRYRLDEDLILVLAMMVIHPEQHRQQIEGR